MRFDNRLQVVLWGMGFALLAVPAAEAARLVPPPSQALTHSRNRIALVEVVGKEAPSHVQCRVLESLHGGTPETELLRVRLRPEAFAEAKAGERYLLGYSTLRKNPLLRDVIEENPDGPIAVRLALAEDALLPDRPELRLLIEAALRGPDAPVAPQFGAVMTLLDGDSPRARQLAIFELFARDDLLALVKAPHLERMAAHIRSTEHSASERDILLKTLLKLPAERRGDAAGNSRAVLAQLDPGFDLSTANPTLALTAATLLAESGNADDLELLAPFVESNNPAVGRAAFDAMRRLDAETAQRRATSALAGNAVHSDVRRYLEGLAEP